MGLNNAFLLNRNSFTIRIKMTYKLKLLTGLSHRQWREDVLCSRVFVGLVPGQGPPGNASMLH